MIKQRNSISINKLTAIFDFIAELIIGFFVVHLFTNTPLGTRFVSLKATLTSLFKLQDSKIMKTIYLFSILLISTNIYAQLEYEGTITSINKTLELDNGTVKYLKYDRNHNKVSIYNLDHTIWKEVVLPLPKYHILDELKHISIHTFNNDELLELIYSCIIYNIPDDYDNIDNENELIDYTLNIINENGDIILKVPNSNEFKIIEQMGQKKIFFYQHFKAESNKKNQTLVYKIL